MSVVLCSAAVGPHTQLLDLAEPTFARYAAEHGFDLHVERDFHIDRPPSWFKLKLIERLHFDYDTVIWVDADAMVVNPHRNILDAVHPGPSLWMTRHHVAGHVPLIPNAGVMVAQRDFVLHDFFRAAWDQEQFIDHPWWEQAAMLDLLGYHIEPPGGLASPGEPTRWTPLVGWLGTEWNSMPHDPHPDPVIRHFTAMSFLSRLEAMRSEPVPA